MTLCPWDFAIVRSNFNPHLPCGRWHGKRRFSGTWNNFNPHLPCGRWQKIHTIHPFHLQFQSTPSLRKVTIFLQGTCNPNQISIHTFLAEGDRYRTYRISPYTDFNPHLPCGRWRDLTKSRTTLYFISIHTFLAEGDCQHSKEGCKHAISIHTFLAEGDFVIVPVRQSNLYFNPHLPCGRWQPQRVVKVKGNEFQSTPSLRKVTYLSDPAPLLDLFQSTPSLRKVTLTSDLDMSAPSDFNPHLPCGRWPKKPNQIIIPLDFNPHLPCGRWLLYSIPMTTITDYFNPHLPCGRWHQPPSLSGKWFSNFNPHLPCGRWQNVSLPSFNCSTFQSTPSLRKVTSFCAL